MVANGESFTPETRKSPFAGHARSLPKDQIDGETEEEACSAFGYVRGIRDRALAIEMRLRSGDCEWFPYSLLGPWRFNPSVGLLLRFTGDVTSLVLISGSNLDITVNNSSTNLTDRGIQRHRITWIREMDESELRAVGEKGPTIDRIEIGEFESTAEIQEWLKLKGPAFLRKT